MHLTMHMPDQRKSPLHCILFFNWCTIHRACTLVMQISVVIWPKFQWSKSLLSETVILKQKLSHDVTSFIVSNIIFSLCFTSLENIKNRNRRVQTTICRLKRRKKCKWSLAANLLGLTLKLITHNLTLC